MLLSSSMGRKEFPTDLETLHGRLTMTCQKCPFAHSIDDAKIKNGALDPHTLHEFAIAALKHAQNPGLPRNELETGTHTSFSFYFLAEVPTDQGITWLRMYFDPIDIGYLLGHD